MIFRMWSQVVQMLAVIEYASLCSEVLEVLILPGWLGQR
jgi:hypothetical protein